MPGAGFFDMTAEVYRELGLDFEPVCDFMDENLDSVNTTLELFFEAYCTGSNTWLQATPQWWTCNHHLAKLKVLRDRGQSQFDINFEKPPLSPTEGAVLVKGVTARLRRSTCFLC